MFEVVSVDVEEAEEKDMIESTMVTVAPEEM